MSFRSLIVLAAREAAALRGMEMAATAGRRSAPAHLWIVGIVATLWNAFGCYDYVMTRTRNMDYLASMPGVNAEEMLAYIDSYPMFAQAGWGLGVWGGLLGSILLLARSRFAVHAFAVSLLGIILSIGWSLAFGPTPPAGTAEGVFAVFPYVIIAVGAALLWYSWRQSDKGVLR